MRWNRRSARSSDAELVAKTEEFRARIQSRLAEFDVENSNGRDAQAKEAKEEDGAGDRSKEADRGPRPRPGRSAG